MFSPFLSGLFGSTTYLLVYVDEILVLGNCYIDVGYVVNQLNKQFTLKDLGVWTIFWEYKSNKQQIVVSSSIKESIFPTC